MTLRSSLKKVQWKADCGNQIIHPTDTKETKLKWEPLVNRRKASKLSLFHKIHHKEVELDFQREGHRGVSYNVEYRRILGFHNGSV